MGLLVFTDVFNIGTGAATSTVVRTGYGFQPKAVIFFWSGNTSPTDSTVAGHSNKGVGVAVSPTSRWAQFTQSEDASASADSDHMLRNDSCVAAMDIAGSIVGRADLQSFDADGLTLVIDDAFPADNDLRVICLALGGTDITDVFASTLTTPALTGDQDITAPGFQPDFALFASSLVSAVNTRTNDSNISIGAAAGATPVNGVVSGSSNNLVQTMTTARHARSGSTDEECIAVVGSAVNAIASRALVTAWLSTGFRLNWTETAGGSLVGYLVIKGGLYQIGDFVTLTTLDTFSETGVPFAPKAGAFFSHCTSKSTLDTIQTHDEISIGVAHAVGAQRAVGGRDEHGVADSNVAMAVEHDAIYVNIDQTADTVEGIVDINSFNSDGWTFEQVDADPAASFVWYIAFGELAAAPRQSIYNISQAVHRSFSY